MMTEENLNAAQTALQPLLSAHLTEPELRVANELFARVRRFLARTPEMSFEYSNRQRLTQLLEIGAKLRALAKSETAVAGELALLTELANVALDHLIMIEPNEFLIARCRVCEKPFMVSRLLAFEELDGRWYPAEPPAHEHEGQPCREGMATRGDPDWAWNQGPLPQPAEWEALQTVLFGRE
ncbi:MAG TPA: hypothetical protein VFV50_17225 [Bdellovibrionales bacterium]|nr:hypothetical protein [Bdellovibrionales bacterium]